MARVREHLLHWGNKYDGPNNYKDGRRGACEDAFWDEDELVDFPRASRKKRKPRKGCPGNDFGPHVYVWVPYGDFYEDYPWTSNRYEIKVCCGCLTRGGQKSFRVRKQT